MQIKLETITPAIAKRYLELNNCNRNIRQNKVHEYANEMKQGRWHLTGDPIRFFDDGTMADGQHRCLGVIESDTTVKIVVVRGLAKEAMAGIDMGAKRSVADYMHLHHGVTDANVMCAGVRAIYCFSFNYQNYTIGADLTKRGLDQYGDCLARAVQTIQKFKQGRCAAMHGALAFGLHARPELIDFVHILSTGEDAKKGNPALSLRNWLISGTSIHMMKSYKAGFYQSVFNAMNAFINNTPITMIKSGPTGINVFLAKERKWIDSVRHEVKGLRPGKL